MGEPIDEKEGIMYRNILVAVVQSSSDDDAIDTAVNLAKTFDGNITLIQVLAILPLLRKDREAEYKILKEKSDSHLAPIKKKVEEKKIPVKTVVRTGNPGMVICKYIEENNIDLVVMPVYDRDMAVLHVGSAAEMLLKRSAKPVLFVREAAKDILKGRTMLVVDDEPDILDTVEDELSMCIVHKAKSKEEAFEFINKNRYDMVILDIMGVDGFTILEHTVKNYIPTVMLTAHALTKEALNKAAKLGATSFLPKDKMPELETFLADVITNEGRPVWKKLFERMSTYFQETLALTPQDEKDLIAQYAQEEGN
jgi:nucleotide-binding universal stress UspA family protein/DNA-binding NarL/FixJ family response regulator